MFEAYFLFREQLIDTPEAFVSHGYQLQHFVLSHLVCVGDELGETAKTSKSGIASTGARGDQSSFENSNGQLRFQCFQVRGAPEANEATPGDDDVGGGKKAFQLPYG